MSAASAPRLSGGIVASVVLHGGLIAAFFALRPAPAPATPPLYQVRLFAAPPGELVLGSDQVLETAEGDLLSKPRSREEAFSQLASLRGKTHRLHSAVVVAEQGEPVWAARESAAMTMRPFSDAFLSEYLDRQYETIRWSVGGYHVEGEGVQLFDRIEGSHFAILGMPLLPLLSYLRERGLLAR